MTSPRSRQRSVGRTPGRPPGVLFNYVGLQTIDGNYLIAANKDVFYGEPIATLSEMHPDLDKRGFMSFAFDGRYKFARYYAPAAFNTPQTLDEIFKYNDVQLFDLRRTPANSTISPSIARRIRILFCA